MNQIDNRPYATWKRAMAPKGWIVRTAIPHEPRLFAAALVFAAEESVYAKEREAVLRYRGLVEEGARPVISAPRCETCGAEAVQVDGKWLCGCAAFNSAI